MNLALGMLVAEVNGALLLASQNGEDLLVESPYTRNCSAFYTKDPYTLAAMEHATHS